MLDRSKTHFYNGSMNAIEPALEELFRHNASLLAACKDFGWGTIEIAVKDGRPVMISVRRDIKLS
ncbi:MAG: hypothetical protein PHD34_06170 [Methanothrix soehngenii]|jgi:hypothetical protein|nr:hypothetical protein [Methanothrix soehngenii]MDD5499103.1 hypothetical protein [Dehalococcoidales bacterium]